MPWSCCLTFELPNRLDGCAQGVVEAWPCCALQAELNRRKSIADAAAAVAGRSITIDTRQDWAAANPQANDSSVVGPSGGAVDSAAAGGWARGGGALHAAGDESPPSEASMAAESSASSFGTCHVAESATGYSPRTSWPSQGPSPPAASSRRQPPQWTLPPTVRVSFKKVATCFVSSS